MEKFTVGSLFAGIGGICKGFENAGATLEWANEIDKDAFFTAVDAYEVLGGE